MAKPVDPIVNAARRAVDHAREAFVNPAPCRYCGGGPTCKLVVMPAKYNGRRLVREAFREYFCWECARTLHLDVTGTDPKRDAVANAKRRVKTRATVDRELDRIEQLDLFDTVPKPIDPITGG